MAIAKDSARTGRGVATKKSGARAGFLKTKRWLWGPAVQRRPLPPVGELVLPVKPPMPGMPPSQLAGRACGMVLPTLLLAVAQPERNEPSASAARKRAGRRVDCMAGT